IATFVHGVPTPGKIASEWQGLLCSCSPSCINERTKPRGQAIRNMLGQRLHRVLGQVLRSLKWLAIPISLLLFLQWSLHDSCQCYPGKATALAQGLSALSVPTSVTSAPRAATLLASDAIARHYQPATRRRLSQLCNVLALAPWALWILVAATPIIVR